MLANQSGVGSLAQLDPVTCLSFSVEIDFATLNGTVSLKIARSFLCDRREAGD